MNGAGLLGEQGTKRTSASPATNSLIPQPTSPVPPVTMTTFFAAASAPLVSAMVVLRERGQNTHALSFSERLIVLFSLDVCPTRFLVRDGRGAVHPKDWRHAAHHYQERGTFRTDRQVLVSYGRCAPCAARKLTLRGRRRDGRGREQTGTAAAAADSSEEIMGAPANYFDIGRYDARSRVPQQQPNPKSRRISVSFHTGRS